MLILPPTPEVGRVAARWAHTSHTSRVRWLDPHIRTAGQAWSQVRCQRHDRRESRTVSTPAIGPEQPNYS